MRGDIGPVTAWSAEINTGGDEKFDWVRSQDYRVLRTQALKWLKGKRTVRFSLICKANGRGASYSVVLSNGNARVDLGGDLITFGDAVIIMKEKLEEEPSE